MAPTRIHILALQKNLKANKSFLKSIAKAKTHPKRKLIIKQATPIQLKTLQHLISAFIRREIPVSKSFENRVKKSKKLKYLLTHFTKINSRQDLQHHLLEVTSVLPIFIKFILKKPKNMVKE